MQKQRPRPLRPASTPGHVFFQQSHDPRGAAVIGWQVTWPPSRPFFPASSVTRSQSAEGGATSGVGLLPLPPYNIITMLSHIAVMSSCSMQQQRRIVGLFLGPAQTHSPRPPSPRPEATNVKLRLQVLRLAALSFLIGQWGQGRIHQ